MGFVCSAPVFVLTARRRSVGQTSDVAAVASSCRRPHLLLLTGLPAVEAGVVCRVHARQFSAALRVYACWVRIPFAVISAH